MVVSSIFCRMNDWCVKCTVKHCLTLLERVYKQTKQVHRTKVPIVEKHTSSWKFVLFCWVQKCITEVSSVSYIICQHRWSTIPLENAMFFFFFCTWKFSVCFFFFILKQSRSLLSQLWVVLSPSQHLCKCAVRGTWRKVNWIWLAPKTSWRLFGPDASL